MGLTKTPEWLSQSKRGRRNVSSIARTSTRLITLLPILIGQPLPLRSAMAQEVGQRFRDCPSCPEMVVVPAGTFIMGSPESEEGRLRAVYDEEGTAVRWTVIDELELEVEEGQRLVIVEGPQRYVTIEVPFAVGVYEVTFDEWDACARSGGCGGLIPDNGGGGRGRRPVINVNWDDANAYVDWLSNETGEEYRLLTEAEWEYVARAGTESARYWGEGAAEQCRHANGADAMAVERHPDWEDGDVLRRACGTGPSGLV